MTVSLPLPLALNPLTSRSSFLSKAEQPTASEEQQDNQEYHQETKVDPNFLRSSLQRVTSLFEKSNNNNNPSNYFPMERLHHTTKETQRALQGKAQHWINYLQDMFQNIGDTLRVYVNRYPPLAALIFTLLTFSAIPVSLFFLFAAVTIAFNLSVALIGFAIIEGVVLMGGAGILLLVLGTITVVTGVGFSWLFAIWLAYRGGCMFFQKLGASASSLSDVVSGQFHGVAQSASERLAQLQQSAQEQAQRAQQSVPPR